MRITHQYSHFHFLSEGRSQFAAITDIINRVTTRLKLERVGRFYLPRQL